MSNSPLLKTINTTINAQLNILISHYNMKNFNELVDYLKENYEFDMLSALNQVSISDLIGVFRDKFEDMNSFEWTKPVTFVDLSQNNLDHPITVIDRHIHGIIDIDMLVYRRNDMIGIEVDVDLESAFDTDKIVSLLQNPDIDIYSVNLDNICTYREINVDEFTKLLAEYDGWSE